MKRVISIIAVLLLTVGLFGGCGTKSGASSQDGASSGEDGVDQPMSLDFVSTEDVKYLDEYGDALYRIVRTESGNSIASVVVKGFKTAFDGVSVKNVIDTAQEDDGSYEILIGDTNRAESAQAKAYLKSLGSLRDDYIICTIGKKIVLTAITESGLTAAVNYFVDNFLKAEGVAGGISYTHRTEGEYPEARINGHVAGKYVVVRPHFNTSYITQIEMEAMLQALDEKCAVTLSIVEDAYEEPSEYEIIVGNTNRDGVKKISDYDTYDITISGTKVYLNGGSPYATAMAVSEFAKMLVSGENVTEDKSVTGSYAAAVKGYDAATRFAPTWVDDFDGNAVDTTKWLVLSGMEASSQGVDGRTSVRSDAPDVVYVKDGCLYIAAKYDDQYFYGGYVTTEGHRMSYQYGYVEVSEIMPDGAGLWTTLWTTCEYNRDNMYMTPEIDINECFGPANYFQANCHAWPTTLGTQFGFKHTSLDGALSNDKRYTHPDGGSFGDGFHTYGMLWDETQMAFTCDGEIYFAYSFVEDDPAEKNAFVDSVMALRFSMATCFESNPNAGVDYDPDVWQNKNKYVADYIHIYQYANGKQKLYVNW